MKNALIGYGRRPRPGQFARPGRATFSRCLLVACVAILSAASPAFAQRDFADWPAGKSPKEIGKRVAERFVVSPHLRTNAIIYPEVCAWYGALTFATLSGDKDLTRRLIARFDPLLG